MAVEETLTPPGANPEDAEKSSSSIAPRVFWPAAVIILSFVLFAVIAPDTAESVIGAVQDKIVGGLGWYYTALVTACVAFAIWVGLGHFGDVKLGRDDEPAEFGMLSWLSMLFAAGMGIGLVFSGVSEPLTHYATPKPGDGGSSTERAQHGLVQTFLHWGIQPWAIYVLVGLAIAYVVHRRGRPVSIRWALEPVLGDRVRGWLGDLIDIVAVVGTLFGVATSLGLGVSQISSGLDFVGLVKDPSTAVKVLLIIGISLLAVASVVTGVGRGIKWLSNTNMGLAGALMLFVLVTGPTLFILREFVQSFGIYLQNLIQLSFDTTALQGDKGVDWQGSWTTFYWGWWISWAPFVGVFIARISRGRTVREFVAGVLLVPAAITFLWFTVFGGTALHRQIFGEGGLVGKGGSVDQEGSLFGMLDALPGGSIMAGLTVILIVLFFVTSSDSGSLVVCMLTSGGNPEPATWSRVFWGVTEGAVAAALLLAGGGGLDALQTMAIIVALPFSLVMIVMAISTIKDFRKERQAFLAAQRRAHIREMTEEVSAVIVEGDNEPSEQLTALAAQRNAMTHDVAEDSEVAAGQHGLAGTATPEP